ncbi:MAG: hypothetical protein ACPHK8_03815 [Thermoplasmatota archaeon]
MGRSSPLPQPLHENRWPLRVFLTISVFIGLVALAAMISAPREATGVLTGSLVVVTILWMLFARSVMRHAHSRPKLVREQAMLWDNVRDEVQDEDLLSTMETMTDEEFLKRAWRIASVVWTTLVALYVPALVLAATFFFTSGHEEGHKMASIPPYAGAAVWLAVCIVFAVRATQFSRQLDGAEREAAEMRQSALRSHLSQNTN